MSDRIGQQFGNYRLLRLLGEGGFAEVYLGEHVHLGTQAAIKILHTRLTGDDRETFRNEARTIARLEHPHIVRVLEFGVEDRTPFLVLSYAIYGNLRQHHPKGSQLPLNTIVAYVKQISEALQYAHDEKLIHRDVKPENMLVGRRNDILLSDFGIAVVAQSSRYQNPQDMAGTMTYMSPEQIQGKPRIASDQYALGIVVYEWLTGRRPFHGSLTELIGQHISTPPPPLHKLMPTIPPPVETVVMKALAKDPKERFYKIAEFALALENACQGIASQPSTIISTLDSQEPSRRTIVIAAAKEEVLSTDPSVQADPPPLTIQQKREQVFALALAHVEAEHFVEALASLEDVLRLDPTFASAHNLRGLTLYHLKRYPEALASLNSAIALNSDDVTAHYGKGLTLEHMQRSIDALAAFERAAQLHTTYVAAWRKQGDILFQLRRYGESLAAYERALQLDLNDTEASVGKNAVLKQLGRA